MSPLLPHLPLTYFSQSTASGTVPLPVEADLRLCAGDAAEVEELVGAELVVLRLSPSQVQHAHAPVQGSNAVAPVISGSIVAAEAQERELQSLGHLDSFGIEAVDVVRGIQQRLVDRMRASSARPPRNRGARASLPVPSGSRARRIPGPFVRRQIDCRLRDDLIGTIPPPERDLDSPAAAYRLGPDAPGVQQDPLHRRIDHLPHTGLPPAGQCHNQQRTR